MVARAPSQVPRTLFVKRSSRRLQSSRYSPASVRELATSSSKTFAASIWRGLGTIFTTNYWNRQLPSRSLLSGTRAVAKAHLSERRAAADAARSVARRFRASGSDDHRTDRRDATVSGLGTRRADERSTDRPQRQVGYFWGRRLAFLQRLQPGLGLLVLGRNLEHVLVAALGA